MTFSGFSRPSQTSVTLAELRRLHRHHYVVTINARARLTSKQQKQNHAVFNWKLEIMTDFLLLTSVSQAVGTVTRLEA